MPSKILPDVLKAGFVLLLLGLLAPCSSLAQRPALTRPANGPAYRADRILVIPKAGREAELTRFHGQCGTRLRWAFPRTGNVQVIEVPANDTAQNMIDRYQRSGHVAHAGFDYWIQAAATPNDPSYANGTLWGLNNFGTNSLGQSFGIADADIDAPEAWDTLNSASNIIVAVVDSGIRQQHEDLAANLWVNPGEIPGNGIDDDSDGVVDDVHGVNAVPMSGPTGNPEDDYGHGTHVSGILGAVGNNGVGICGVAWRVQIMPCKFLDSTGGGYLSTVLYCLDYAKAHGAKVINCSFETPPAVNPVDDAPLSNAFWSLRVAGIVVVCAAGNGGLDTDQVPRYPASFPMDNIVSVTATTRSDGFRGFNYGVTSVDLGAPGSDILSTYNRSNTNYYALDGTSMSTAYVSGAVALLLARFPSFDHRQIINRLLLTTDPLPSLTGRCSTGGRLNLARALGLGHFSISAANYAWVPTNGMTALTLTDDGVTGALALPFTFNYYGLNYRQIFVGANGMVGLTNTGLTAAANLDLPSTSAPRAVICPLWDDLNPALGGSMWMGTIGTRPNRKAVISWVDVPHKNTAGGQTKLSFQAILHESRQISFQYQQVQSGVATLVSGKSATIGVADYTGMVATEYSYNGSPWLVTNKQAILFTAAGGTTAAPSIAGGLDGSANGFLLTISGPPAQRCVLGASGDLTAWTELATNSIPASGEWAYTNVGAGALPQRFYRAVLKP